VLPIKKYKRLFASLRVFFAELTGLFANWHGLFADLVFSLLFFRHYLQSS
jgi:hypothetical protein